ncbi:MAG: (E)-4-hydroxy-3-methylbut-2-enyl-diphosphate synthase [Verrucomicrobiales bacterium]|nr:(E)-4-hydroxy-3-methylbut-2-enyl-diphosphate synthase [Verrucomicrobiales bacterium]
MKYCADYFKYSRRQTREVRVGGIGIGGGNPIRVQSMLTSDTRDVEACVQETLALVEVGCELVRVTAQTRKIAENLQGIVAGVRAAGSEVPIVADIHFKPDAAMEAAKWVQKVRVNPGNYADKKKFQILEYSDDEYQAELERIDEAFSPLVKRCQENGVAMRIGTNHGSLSDRIMNRYGDTPLGMVESALEFVRIARSHDYHELIFSMKASNPKVMIEAYRLLAARLLQEGEDWNYPLHLGVTEAGDGEDGRIKSAIGIGSLLADGLGDTVRVSLTEDSVHEIPVAKALVEWVGEEGERSASSLANTQTTGASLSYDPFDFVRRGTKKINIDGYDLGAEQTVRIVTTPQVFDAVKADLVSLGEFQPEIVLEKAGEVIRLVDVTDEAAVEELNALPHEVLVAVADDCDLSVVAAYRLLAAKLDTRHSILLKDGFCEQAGENSDQVLLAASARIGSLLCDGIGDAIWVRGEVDAERSLRLAYNILQSAGTRIFKTDYVACPSCGRTLFDLQTTTQSIREATGHLKGVRIAVMGCIVNGPGEMADADFGYVGGAPGKINLYVGKEAVKFNIAEGEAVQQLVDLIREHGKWVDAPVMG